MIDKNTGKPIPFCKQTFSIPIERGQEDLTQYVSLTVTDRNADVGKIRLKLSTLMGKGKALTTTLPENASFQAQMKLLKGSHSEWYPMFEEQTN